MSKKTWIEKLPEHGFVAWLWHQDGHHDRIYFEDQYEAVMQSVKWREWFGAKFLGVQGASK